MTLMIGTTELAKACYAVWRAYEQLHGHEMARVRSYYAMIEMHRTLVWDHLSNREQQQWRQVAMAAGQKLTGAFGDREVCAACDGSGAETVQHECERCHGAGHMLGDGWEVITVAPSDDPSGAQDVANMRAALGGECDTSPDTCDTGELD
jgi:hypothetical protein